MDYLFGQPVSDVLAMYAPNLWPTPRLLAFGGEGGVGDTTRMLWEHCSAVAKTLLCCPYHSSHKYKAQHYEGCYGES